MELKRITLALAIAVGSLASTGCFRSPAPPLSPEAQAVVLVTSNPAQAMLLARVCEPAGVVDGPHPGALREQAAAQGNQVVEILYTDGNSGRKSKTTAVLHRCDPSIDIQDWLDQLA